MSQKVPQETEVVTDNLKGLSNGGGLRISQAQKEILNLLLKEKLTIATIAQRRGCSKQAVSKVFRKLKQMGLINHNYQGGVVTPGLLDNHLNRWGVVDDTFVSCGKHGIRLHGQAWKVRILHKDQAWRKRIQSCNQVVVDGNTIMMHNRQILIYCGHSFVAESVDVSTTKSVEYLQRLLKKLENDFRVVLVKARSQNILQFRAHYAEVGNELAVDCEKKAERIKIFTNDDGKLWFTVDNSFNLREAETQHPQTARADMEEVVVPFFNDLRDNKPPCLSKIMGLIQEVVEVNKETAAGLNGIVKLMGMQQVPDPLKSGDCKPDYLG